MDRRSFLSVSALAAAVPLTGLPAAAQSVAAKEAPKPSRSQRLAEAMAANRMPLRFDGRRFSGAGYDWLVRQGSDAQSFLLGEEHGIAENPRLAAQLFAALVPSGYRHVAIEISPTMAGAIDQALSSADPGALRTLLTTPESRVAFFGMREEADWLRSARSALPDRRPFLWGMDYEVGADRYLIRRLKVARKPAAAAQALARLEAASASSWAQFEKTHDPKFIYSFAGDPELVRQLRAAWPHADADSVLVMETLEQTFAINRLWFEKKGYESNLVRSRFMRANFQRYWKAKPPEDRFFMKMGASHMVRGASMTDIFDLGTMVPEMIAERGGKTFHLLVLPGPGTQTASIDPSKFLYVSGKRDQYGAGMELFDEAVLPNTFTLFDTAPLRPIASSYSGEVPLPLWRVIHGFDAVLIMTGSQPSTNL